MKTILSLAIVLVSFSALAQEVCFEGKLIIDSTINVQEVLELKMAQGEDLKDLFTEEYKKVDFNNPLEAKKWSMVTGTRLNYLITKNKNSVAYNNSCAKAAQKFFVCMSQTDANMEATLNYRTEFLTYDLTDVVQQRKWQLAAPALQAQIDASYKEMKSCESKF